MLARGRWRLPLLRAPPGCWLLTPGWQQAPGMTFAVSDHCGGADRADQGKLPLRQNTVRSERGSGQRDALYLLALFEARHVVGVLHAGAVSPDHTDGKRRDLSMEQPDRKAPFLRQLRLRHLFGVTGLVDRQA